MGALEADLLKVTIQTHSAFYRGAVDRLSQVRHNGWVEQKPDDCDRGDGPVYALLGCQLRDPSFAKPEHEADDYDYYGKNVESQ